MAKCTSASSGRAGKRVNQLGSLVHAGAWVDLTRSTTWSSGQDPTMWIKPTYVTLRKRPGTRLLRRKRLPQVKAQQRVSVLVAGVVCESVVWVKKANESTHAHFKKHKSRSALLEQVHYKSFHLTRPHFPVETPLERMSGLHVRSSHALHVNQHAHGNLVVRGHLRRTHGPMTCLVWSCTKRVRARTELFLRKRSLKYRSG